MMFEKDKYTLARIEIIRLCESDVLTSSTPTDDSLIWVDKDPDSWD